MSLRISCFITFIAFATSMARAQTVPPASPPEPDGKLHLDNVVVTASPLARAQDEIASPTSVLAGPALNRQLQGTLGETLTGQPGVDSTYFGPGASRPIIRGLGGDRIRVLTGGVGTIDASVISPDHAVSLDPLLIERVEVVRGPASLLYGGGAIGGVVNIVDGRIPETLPDGRPPAASRYGATRWRTSGPRRESSRVPPARWHGGSMASNARPMTSGFPVWDRPRRWRRK
jgi:iron complex outermembrane receptor protein